MKPPPPGPQRRHGVRVSLNVLTTAVATVVSASKPWKLRCRRCWDRGEGVRDVKVRVADLRGVCGAALNVQIERKPRVRGANGVHLVAMRRHVGLNGPARVHEALERSCCRRASRSNPGHLLDVLVAKAVCHGKTTLLYFRIHVVVR